MVCPQCGFENPAIHRFCGMCGIPLPQKAITAPGAQSTLGLIRLPVEVTGQASSTLSALQPAVEERQSTGLPSRSRTRSEKESIGVGEQVAEASSTPQSPIIPSKSYFAEAEMADSLEQFIAGFHYTPPSEEDEVTMTGDKPVLDATAKYEPPAPVSMSGESDASAEPLFPSQETAPDITNTKDDAQLTVEVFPSETAPSKRSRFLDFSEPAVKPPAKSGVSIVGPSFLGLSDPPPENAVELPSPAVPRSHWRAWLAVVVIAIFGVLGYLEWRAERNQTNGPIGLVKMQFERLKGGKGALVTPATPPPAPKATPAGEVEPQNSTGPSMEVTPQAKSPSANPSASNPVHTATPTPQKPANQPGQGSSSPAPAKPADEAKPTATPQADKAAGAVPSQEAASGEQAAGGMDVPGKEELLKAENASDPAATAVWLWRAVAKGNPEAPVRLANLYIKGDGIPQNCDQAIVLLQSAAAKENAAARSRLGSLYATGTCVDRDRVRAFEYMSSALAANPNAAWARDFREQIWAKMTPQERAQAQKYR